MIMEWKLSPKWLPNSAKEISGLGEDRTIEFPERKSSYHCAALGDTDAVATGDHMEGLIGSVEEMMLCFNIKLHSNWLQLSR